MPKGWYARIIGRSSALRKRGLLVIEGTIDAGYRGELYSYVYNPGQSDVEVRAGDALAQMLFLPVPDPKLELVLMLPASERGDNGFGSSGR